MSLKDLVRRKNRRIVSGPSIRLSKHVKLEYGGYLDYINNVSKPTKGLYVGITFRKLW